MVALLWAGGSAWAGGVLDEGGTGDAPGEGWRQLGTADLPVFEGVPIVNGKESSLTDHPYVVLVGAEQGGYWAPFCSGTVIADKWVVTAAHCNDPFEPGQDYDGWTPYVYLGADIWNGEVSQRIQVTERYAHPKWNGDIDSGADIALFKLRTTADAEPVVLNDETPDSSWWSKNLLYVGFGITRDDLDDSGVQRYVEVPFDDMDSNFIYGYAANKNFCSGDSGGATFEQVKQGLELAGVISFTYGGCVGGQGGSTRIDKYLPWIEGYATVKTSWPDGDADTDADADSDVDADTDADGDADNDWTDPARPPDDAYAMGCMAAPVQGGPQLLWYLALLPLVRRRRR
jgi:hypothetical protein